MGLRPHTEPPTPSPDDEDAWAAILRQRAILDRASQTLTATPDRRQANLRRFPTTSAEAEELIQQQKRERAALIAELGLH